ncbi:hypothetical protein EDB81DRAFT_918365 [Dactylonectria macrodidyma]|uniref:DNA (cytosine-5)-methyltransferase 1 replication foci domain-containing protein n=1 Tax=Dactylonectria macrodidyma TaxID=307937 RepID=A0A9P9FN75_9HYPO|nr:hypothetical protein EDB81DRAFT_918365 [Dactylonectria macrodidyma]
MSGRNRRASTSSVDTVDENQILWRQETSVLKSIPKLSDSNDWPIFELRDAVVLNKDGQTIENALNVGTRGPFIVRGTLIIDDPSQKQHLIMRVRTSIPIEVRQSISYSIGEAEDGQPLIWVSGKGGWYEIFPSPTYLPVYNKMCEAAMLYYRIMDIYKNQKAKKVKKGKRTDPMTELSHYAAKVGDGSTLDEVTQRCIEHAPFLITQFTQEDPEEFDWRPTFFYSWLTGKHADLLAKAKERLLNPPQLPRSPSAEVVSSPVTQVLPSRTRVGSSTPSLTRNPPSRQTATRTSAPRERSTRSRSLTQKDEDAASEALQPQQARVSPDVAAPPIPNPAPSEDLQTPTPVEADNLTPFETVLKALEQTYVALEGSRHGLTVLSTLNKIYFVHKFPNYREGGPGSHKIPVMEVLQYNAKELLQVIDKDKYGKHEIYSWLEEAAKREFNPIAIKLSEFPYRLVPRGTRAPRAPKIAESMPVVSVGGVPRQALDDDASSSNSRPSSRAGKGPRGRRSGKKSSLRLAVGSKKRPHSEVESDWEEEELGAKKSHYFSDDDLDDSGNTSSPEDEDTRLSDEEPIKILIRADKIPSTVPHGPHNTWTCEEEDCGYIVRGGDKEECQERIRLHFQDHEQQAKRVCLAMSESRGQLPIKYAYFPPFLILVEFHSSATSSPMAAPIPTTSSATNPTLIQYTSPTNPPSTYNPTVHLIDKLKSMGEKSQRSEQISVDGTLLPQHIKRNLYV